MQREVGWTMCTLEKDRGLEVIIEIFERQELMFLSDMVDLVSRIKDVGCLGRNGENIITFVKRYPRLLHVCDDIIQVPFEGREEALLLYSWFHDNIYNIVEHFDFKSIVLIHYIRRRLEEKKGEHSKSLIGFIGSSFTEEFRETAGRNEDGLKKFLQKFQCIFETNDDDVVSNRVLSSKIGHTYDNVTDENWNGFVGRTFLCIGIVDLLLLLYIKSIFMTAERASIFRIVKCVQQKDSIMNRVLMTPVTPIQLITLVKAYPEIFSFSEIIQNLSHDQHEAGDLAMMLNHREITMSKPASENCAYDFYETTTELENVTGQIFCLFQKSGYGMIRTEDGEEVYFTKDKCLFDDEDWDKLEVNDSVYCSAELGPQGKYCKWKAIEVSLSSLNQENCTDSESEATSLLNALGQIVCMFPDRAYGMIQIEAGEQVYFTKKACLFDEWVWDGLEVDDVVYCNAELGPNGKCCKWKATEVFLDVQEPKRVYATPESSTALHKINCSQTSIKSGTNDLQKAISNYKEPEPDLSVGVVSRYEPPAVSRVDGNYDFTMYSQVNAPNKHVSPIHNQAQLKNNNQVHHFTGSQHEHINETDGNQILAVGQTEGNQGAMIRKVQQTEGNNARTIRKIQQTEGNNGVRMGQVQAEGNNGVTMGQVQQTEGNNDVTIGKVKQTKGNNDVTMGIVQQTEGIEGVTIGQIQQSQANLVVTMGQSLQTIRNQTKGNQVTTMESATQTHTTGHVLATAYWADDEDVRATNPKSLPCI